MIGERVWPILCGVGAWGSRSTDPYYRLFPSSDYWDTSLRQAI